MNDSVSFVPDTGCSISGNTSTGIKMLILALTGACNFRCTYCYAAAQPTQKIPRAALRWALDKAGADGEPFLVQFTGGEPLLAFERLVYAVDYIREKGYKATLQVQTNGSLVTPAIAQYLAKEKIGVGVSLDGGVTYNDAARVYPDGSGTAKDIMQGLRILAEAGIGVGVTCVVGSHNIHALESIVDMVYYAGNVHKLGFDLLRPQGRASAEDAVSEAEMREALTKVLARAEMLEKLTGRHLIFSHQQRVAQLAQQRIQVFSHCYALTHQALFVNAIGECYSCASLSGYPEFRIGSYLDDLDVNKEDAVAANLEKTMARCRACEYLPRCGGGCYARWVGMKNAYQPECVLKKMFIRLYEKKGKRGVSE